MLVATIARKPISMTVVDNVLVHGVGGFNIDDCRITPTGERLGGGDESAESIDGKWSGWSRPWMHDPAKVFKVASEVRDKVEKATTLGRWPANVILIHLPECREQGNGTVWECAEGCPVAYLNQTVGITKSGSIDSWREGVPGPVYGHPSARQVTFQGDAGFVSRFFKQVKR